MIQTILKMEGTKKLARKIEKEMNHLYSLDSLTDKKQRAIQGLKEKHRQLRQEFDEEVAVVKQWLKDIPDDEKYLAEIIEKHYCDFNSLPQNLQVLLDASATGLTASNFRAKIERIWLNQFRK